VILVALIFAIVIIYDLTRPVPARGWGYGYYPSGALGLVLLLLVFLMLFSVVPWWGWGPPPVR
jgi:hypothetical protein